MRWLLAAAVALATAASPAEPAVTVVRPVEARITRYLEASGTVAAMQSVDLVARVAGTLDSIGFEDGALVKKGTTLFVIEPLPYESKLRQAQAAEEQQRALGVQTETEYGRQAQLRNSSASSQSQLDSATASRDSSRAALAQAQEATRQAAITYAYTRVSAPFDGVMTAHLVSTGSLVGSGGPTKLASILQLDPIWVNATISEAQVLQIRALLAARGKTVRDLGAVAADAALAGESSFPHAGRLDYVAPMVDPATGTLAIRARFDNPGYALLPGYFVRLRIPLQSDAPALLVPEDAIVSDQGTPTVLVVDADGHVAPRAVTLGGSARDMRIVDRGIGPGDRIVASGSLDAEPGARVRAVEAPGASPAKP